jgi:antitoxin (DNA-binding transcriptional repressor) of toxin-antitoxin stability system
MLPQPRRVGIREFRENLTGFLESPKPVAITRHGQTIGFFVPARRRPEEADLEALRRAGEQLATLIERSGASEEDLVSEFKAVRKARRSGLIGHGRGNVLCEQKKATAVADARSSTQKI